MSESDLLASIRGSLQLAYMDDGLHLLMMSDKPEDGAYDNIPMGVSDFECALHMARFLRIAISKLRTDGQPPGEGKFRKEAAEQQWHDAWRRQWAREQLLEQLRRLGRNTSRALGEIYRKDVLSGERPLIRAKDRVMRD